METPKRLIIYKASAGSGKTFRLAVEYIKIVVSNPDNYRKTLAVTFTNKATDEMKKRILTHLYGIAYNLPSSDLYFQTVKQDLSLSETQIRKRAKETLSLLIHNYHYFRIETIDSFFQRIFRNLAHELQLTANLRIELNDSQIEQSAVDNMIEELKNNDIILEWLINFIREKINEDKKWDIIKDIKKFGNNIFNHTYKSKAKQLHSTFNSDSSYNNYKTKLNNISIKAEKELKNRGEEFFKILSDNGLETDDISGKSRGISGYFLNLKNGVFDKTNKKIEDYISNPASWATKTSVNANKITQLANDSLCNFLSETERERKKLSRLIQSVALTKRNLNELRLLETIEKQVNDSNKEYGRFLLSNTQDLLHEMIDDNDSPFIFEKIGSRIEHIMIDEFQDTSSVQWSNFKVLLNDCMGHNDSTNLIVGDVKQSIYRWRAGDWQLLNNIENEFPTLSEEIKTKALKTNYRSTSRIVDFNNKFFTYAANYEFVQLENSGNSEAKLINDAYNSDELTQIIPNKTNTDGYVDIKLLSKEKYKESTLEKIEDIIITLTQQGVNPNDIAILARTNEQITLIADYLIKHLQNTQVVSDEAFQLKASPCVCLIIEALHFISHPDDLLSKVYITKTYQKIVLNNDLPESEILKWHDKINNYLPKEFVENYKNIASMPLYDMAEFIYRVFELDKIKGQDTYVYTFFDELRRYLDDNIGDIDNFISIWNDELNKKSIQINESDGIRILTIHRSKGLEFDHVIIPFCDWATEKQGNTLWCSTTEEPFSELPIIPIAYYVNQMKNSVYDKCYEHEHIQNIIDNLNLLYVAFTRAGRSLFILGKNGTKSGRSKLIEEVLVNLSKEFSDAEYVNDDDSTIFIWGNISIKQAMKSNSSKNVFEQAKINEELTFTAHKPNITFKESNESNKFISGNTNEYIDTGNILHNMLSEIRNINDVENVISKYEKEGLLSGTTVSPTFIRNTLNKSFSNKTISRWFSGNSDTFIERTIITKKDSEGFEEYRPDRVIKIGDEIVVVDFKFAKPDISHHNQVRQYMQLLHEMGYNKVRGNLWYVFRNEILQVSNLTS